MILTIPTLSEIWQRIAPKKAAAAKPFDVKVYADSLASQLSSMAVVAWTPYLLSPQPAPQGDPHMASFTSILSDIGNGLKKFFGVAVSVATAAEPFIDQLFPGIATLYSTVLTEVAKAETAAIAAGQQNGTGVQKLAMVVQAVAAQFPQYTPAQLEIIINGVVAGLNAIPAKTTSPA